tara:strand:+ start:4726 stop:4956 length:231 start_codon:yes stop_codon:yes gene_type:complete
MKLKYSVHDTKEEAEAEDARLSDLLGITEESGFRYCAPFEHKGSWLLQVDTEGHAKADHLCEDLVELDLEEEDGES